MILTKLSYSGRDLIEKYIILKVKNSKGVTESIIYTSSVPDVIYPVQKDVVRATTIFYILKLTPLKDGRTMFSSYTQVDPNFFFNISSIFKRLCGPKMKEWYESLTTYMDGVLKAEKSNRP